MNMKKKIVFGILFVMASLFAFQEHQTSEAKTVIEYGANLGFLGCWGNEKVCKITIVDQ
jgi:hypothetical protein